MIVEKKSLKTFQSNYDKISEYIPKYFVVSKKISSFHFLLVKYYLINSPYKIPTVLTMQVIINSKTRSLIVSKRQ